MRDSSEAAPPPIEKAVAPRGRLAQIFRDVRDALVGGRHDLTKETLNRTIWLLAIPMVLETVMESIFAVVDMFWVSHLGPNAMAAVGITESLMTVIYAIAIGGSIATAAIVARRIGEKNPEGAGVAAVQGIALGVVAAAILGVVGALVAPRLLQLMGADPGVLASGATFSRIMLGGNATVFLIFLINAVFRGAGDPTVAMRTLWLANILNIVLGPCFIFGWGPFPELGVAGAAVATNIGRGIGVLYQVMSLVRGSPNLQLRARNLKLDFAVMRVLVGIATNGVGQLLINTASWVALMGLIARFGSISVAGYAVAMRLVMFATLPAWGLGNAAATLVGQNLGANQPARAEQAAWVCARYNIYFLGAVAVVFVIFAPQIVGLFPGGPEVTAAGATALRIIGLGFPLYAYGLVLGAAFNGAGDTRTPTRMNLFCFWLFELPLAWVLSGPLGMGPTGIYIAIAVAFSLLACVAIVVFKRGGWKLPKI